MFRSDAHATVALVVLSCTLASACGRAPPSTDAQSAGERLAVLPPAPGEKTVMLLAMDSGDTLTNLYVTRVLLAHGIWSSTQGSIGWSTAIRAAQAKEAERLLRKEDGLRGYVTWLPTQTRDEAPKPPTTTATIEADLADALASHAADTVVGRILRTEYFQQRAKKLVSPQIETVTWSERPFVTKELKRSTALDSVVRILHTRQHMRREYHVVVFDE